MEVLRQSCPDLELGIQTSCIHTLSMDRQTNQNERCRKHLTVKHITVEFRKFTATLNEYYYNHTLLHMLADNCSVAKIVAYLQAIDISAKL